MAEYAHVVGQRVESLHDLDPAVHAAWMAAGNAKAQSYRPVVVDPVPAFDSVAQVVDERMTVQPTRVVRGWAVRPKTADEKRVVRTAYEFLSRFTPSELDSVRVRSQTDPAMWRFLTFASAAQEVVSDDPVTVQGMDYLVSCGIVTAARRNEILGVTP